MLMAKIYVAGKNLSRARAVIDALKQLGHVITYDWVTVIETGPSKEKAMKELEGVRLADVLVYLWENNQESARYEAGMAMGLGKTIVVSGKSDAFFFQLPDVHCVDSDDQIATSLKRITTAL